MTSKEFYQLLASIKRCFSRSPTHKEALLKAKCLRKKGPKGGARYRCAACKKDFGARDVQVDHKKPVIPLQQAAIDMSWDSIISNLYCPVSNLQVLCKECHKIKSAKENKIRRQK